MLFEDVKVKINSKSKWPKGLYDLRPGFGQKIEEIPSAGFYMRRADGVTIRNSRVVFEGEERACFGEAIHAQDCADLVIEGFKGEAARPELEAIVIE